jgi:hypothetical protein
MLVTASVALNILLEKLIAVINHHFSWIVKNIEFHFQHRYPLIELVGCRPEFVVSYSYHRQIAALIESGSLNYQ